PRSKHPRRLVMSRDHMQPGRVHITPVATSATPCDGADAATAMLDFARTVSGTNIGEDAVITETRVDLDEFVRPSREVTAHHAGDAAGEGPSLSPAQFPAAASMATAVRPHLEPGTPLDAGALTADVLDVLWPAHGAEHPSTGAA